MFRLECKEWYYFFIKGNFKEINWLNDKLISVFTSLYQNVFVSTDSGYGLWFDITEIPIVGLKASGVKSINLKNYRIVSAKIIFKDDVNNFSSLIKFLILYKSNILKADFTSSNVLYLYVS